MQNKLRVVTILSDLNQPGFKEYLEPSCKYYNLNLTVLNCRLKYTTHRVKDELLKEHLSEFDPNDIVLFTDGHDTLMMAKEEEILNKFAWFNKPLVFSAEVNCWPDAKLISRYPASNESFKYLNCGGFIGKVAFLVNIYENFSLYSKELNSQFFWSNQYYWQHVFLASPGEIVLDHECKLFYNTATMVEKIRGIDFSHMNTPRIMELYHKEIERLSKELSFNENRITSRTTGEQPCHLHFPGPISKLLMQLSQFEHLKPWL